MEEGYSSVSADKVMVHLYGRFMNKSIRPNAVPSSVTVVESHLIQRTPDNLTSQIKTFHFPGQNVHPCICCPWLKCCSRQLYGTLMEDLSMTCNFPTDHHKNPGVSLLLPWCGASEVQCSRHIRSPIKVLIMKHIILITLYIDLD